MKYQESKLAHKFLDGLYGIEIGGSAHNSFGLNTKNVDYSGSNDTIYKCEEIKLCDESMAVDIIAPGDKLPLPDESQDFVISSHVLEHFPDPIKALKEWHRVIRRGGYIFMIVPHKERTFDKENRRTTLKELTDRHEGKIIVEDNFEKHHSVWVTEDLVELINYLGWRIVFFQNVDDKVGNGFTVVVQKGKCLIDLATISSDVKEMLFEKFDCVLKDEKDIEALAKGLEKKIEIARDNQIKNLIAQVSGLQKEGAIIKGSKFWKLQNKYVSLKNKVLSLKKIIVDFFSF